MFVQVIKGTVSDEAGLRAQLERWEAEIRPGAVGFLGSSGGVADDGTFVGFARFADEAAAAANSSRPEQRAWWEAVAACFASPPTFRETSDVSVLFDGGSDDAGFVQVMEGSVADRAAAERLETPELMASLRDARPDLIGAIRAWFDDGSYAEMAYFTSEEAARAGEASADFEASQQEYVETFGEPTFTDLRSPMLVAGG